jgi:hypothetical protein
MTVVNTYVYMPVGPEGCIGGQEPKRVQKIDNPPTGPPTSGRSHMTASCHNSGCLKDNKPRPSILQTPTSQRNVVVTELVTPLHSPSELSGLGTTNVDEAGGVDHLILVS